MSACSAKLIEPGGGSLGFGPGGDRYLNKLSSADTAGAFLLTEIEVSPGSGPPLHRHTREDELFIMLEGEITFWIDGHVQRAGAGTVVYGPRNIPHTFKNCSDRKARAMVLVTPAAAEGFFRGFGEPLPGTSMPPSEEIMIERIMKLAPQYGIEILGPSPL